MTMYTPEDVYEYACVGNNDKLSISLKFRENRINWYQDEDGWNALHRAIYNNQHHCIDILMNVVLMSIVKQMIMMHH